MPFSVGTVSVGTQATLLANPSTAAASDPQPVVIFNNDAAATLFIGGTGVTTANGFPILKQTGISFRLISGEQIFGIVAAGTLDARVLQGRK